MSQLDIVKSVELSFFSSYNIRCFLHEDFLQQTLSKESRLIQLLMLEHEQQIKAILEKLNHVKIDEGEWNEAKT